jgi:hypothetical protein
MCRVVRKTAPGVFALRDFASKTKKNLTLQFRTQITHAAAAFRFFTCNDYRLP